MAKINASELVILDDFFMAEIIKKLKDKGVILGKIKKQYNTKEVALICSIDIQTVQRHISNYIKEIDGSRKLKAFKPEGTRNYIIKKEDLDVYRGLI